MRSSIDLSVGLSAFHFRSGGALSVPGSLQLADQPRLLKLGKHASDLTHGNFERVTGFGKIIPGTGQDANAALDEGDDARLLNDELPGKPGSVLDENSSNSVALDPI